MAALSYGGCSVSVSDESGQPENFPQTKEQAAEATDLGKADWSLDPCLRWGWYDDGMCDWFCFTPDPDCAPPTLLANPTGQRTDFPIVLAHGFDSSHQGEGQHHRALDGRAGLALSDLHA